MRSSDTRSPRSETDASLRAERKNTDHELSTRVAVADADADQVLRIARERADRLLAAARAAADARLPLSEQTKAAVELLLDERGREDRALAEERERADVLLDRERQARREKLSAMLVLERETTDLHLALERRSSDNAVWSRDEFLAQASHDLRGLTAAQKIYLSLLTKEAGNGEYGSRLAPHLATLVKIDEEMDRLVNDLVDLVAVEAGKLSVELKAYSAAELLSTATAVFAPLAKERDQSLQVIPMAADVSVLADASRIMQVLGNLLSNAIKFTPGHGEIRVGFQASHEEVVFLVSDTGPLVPAELADRIFERFVGSSGSAQGLGLGLFIASRLVEAHGGRIWFDRGTPAGSVFRFALRRAA